MGKRDKAPPAPPAAPFNNPFAALASRAAGMGAGAPSEEASAGTAPPSPAGGSAGLAEAPRARAAPAAPAAAPPPRPGPARAVVRMERAGRGGRTVTVVEKLGLPPRELESWCGTLKRAMGCGGAVEGDALVIQGDVRERVGAWLEARGVRKVTLG